MKTIILKELKRTYRSLFLWCLIIAIIVVFGILEYPFVSQYIQDLMPVFDAMPKIVSIMFGIYQVDFTSTLGYYVCMYFWCTLITYVHAMYLGASIVIKEERDKTADYLFTKPYARKTIVQAKLIAALVNVFIVAAVSGGLSILALLMIGLNGHEMQLVFMTIIGMFFTQVILMVIGLLCSLMSKSYKKGVLMGMICLMVFYAISITIQYVGNINYLNFLSPLQYFDAKLVIASGFNLFYLGCMALILIVGCLLCFRKIAKREFY